MAAVGAGERPDGGSEARVLVHKKGNKPREYPLGGVVLTTYLRWLYPRKRAELAPLVAVLAPLQGEIDAADDRLSALAAADPGIRRLMSVPGVGPVTAAAFVAALDDVTRCATARHAAAYLGLVPREWSSGEQLRRGAITKAGSPRARSLLVEAAWCITRSKRADLEPLRTWAARIAQQRGPRVALVALARRLAGILYALWRDGTDFGARRRATAA